MDTSSLSLVMKCPVLAQGSSKKAITRQGPWPFHNYELNKPFSLMKLSSLGLTQERAVPFPL